MDLNPAPQFETPPASLDPKKSWFAMHKVLGVVFLLAAAGAAVAGIYYWQTVRNLPTSYQPIVHKDPTANWKTYTNSQYSFEFKYPNNTVVLDNVKDDSGYHSVYIRKSDWERQEIGLLPQLIFHFDPKITSATTVASIKKSIQGDRVEILSDNQVYGANAFVSLTSHFTGDGYETDQYFILRTKNGSYVFLSPNLADIPVDQILSTFKFTDQQADASSWKTYTNSELGFSIQYPNDLPPSTELNDKYNRYVGFGKAYVKFFDIRIEKDINPEMGIKYGKYDSEVVSTNIKIGGTVGYEAISKAGYADAGQQGVPFVEFGVRHQGDIYHITFAGDSVVSSEEQQILSTFKFTQ